MEAQLNQPKTYGAQEFAQTFFRDTPTDQRFLQNTFQKIPPSSSLTTRTIEFSLSRFEAANLYLIQDTHLQVKVRIVKSTGTLPDTAKVVAPCNNILHSMFENVRVYLNDEPIFKNPSYYPYKAYITNTLTYSSSYKSAQLSTEGYYPDLHNHMGAEDNNSGFQERNYLFRLENKAGSAYNPAGVRFIGKLQLDLISCTTGLPPGTKVKIELDRSRDDFLLMKKSDDTENYKLELLECNLFIPIAQLSAPLFSEIGSAFSHQSINIHFRRIEIRPISLPKDKEEYSSDLLFQDDMPCRIVICFIESKNKTGDQTLNPFDFQRHWKKVSLGQGHANLELSLRERLLEEKLNAMQQKLDKFQSFLDLDSEMLRQIEEFQANRKSPSGRGKRSQSFQGSSSIFTRLRNTFTTEQQEISSPTPSTSRGTRTPPPTYEETESNLNATINVHVKRVCLELNGAPVDQIDTT